MSKLILIRHAQSEWNKRGLFTGWVDVPLSEEGVNEALAAAKLVSNLPVDVIITTTLIRAQMTAMLVMLNHSSGKIPVIFHPNEGQQTSWEKIYSDKSKQETVPVIRTTELNERMYGELQGLNKAETVAEFGADQVKQWRRSYDTSPPGGESLSMTADRAIPYFKETILPMLDQGLNVLVSAHGNSLRSIVMFIDQLTKEEVLHLEIPTGVPIIYEYQDGIFNKCPN